VILLDSSVWISVFRRDCPLDLAAEVHFDEVVTCLPVIQEVLQGFRAEDAWRKARESMLALPIVESPLRVEVIEEAVALFRQARRAGVTIRSSVDCVIAACALRNNLEVLHIDRDYPSLARVSGLRQRRLE
jgi:predicted nucleic acid-binding protein